MKRNLIFIIISLAFLFTGINVNAQNTEDADPAYFELDEHPTFKGGTPNDFAYWVARHVKYPKEAKALGIEGTVMVHFIIDTNGKISEAHVHEGVHQLLDEEAVRVIKKSPKWKPGKKDGNPVSVSYNMPVIFAFR
ncbi:MAG: energy transducer TonB [Bacteroidales bacterium]|nr:energy transducer TonB [Bacteroidales bacterium]